LLDINNTAINEILTTIRYSLTKLINQKEYWMLFPFTLPEETPDSLDRFIGRLLRRDVMQQLKLQEYKPDDPFQVVLFGSAVVQANRPSDGYPIRRMARDIDIGFMSEERSHDPGEEHRQQIGKYILRAVGKAGAKVIDGTLNGIPGYDGLQIQKTYTREQITAHLEGRTEEHDVDLDRESYTATLGVEKAIMRSPLLNPVPAGDTGFHHIDLREIAAEKMSRMVSKNPVTRDIVDIYNMISTDPPRIDVDEDRELLRCLVVINMTKRGGNASLDMLEVNENNIQRVYNQLFARHEEQLADLGKTEQTERDRKDLERTKEIIQKVADFFEKIFPRDIKRNDDFPDHIKGALNLTRSEVRFGMHLLGVDSPPNTPHYFREQVVPGINGSMVIPYSVSSKHPELSGNLSKQHELEERVKYHLSQRMMADF